MQAGPYQQDNCQKHRELLLSYDAYFYQANIIIERHQTQMKFLTWRVFCPALNGFIDALIFSAFSRPR
jgi:hypothetical protein